MALVLVCVVSVTIDTTWRPPIDEKKAQFALIHKQWIIDDANCDGRGPTQYKLCRELAWETFIAESRLIK